MEYQIMKTFSQYYREHISEIDAILLDIDGTVLIGPKLIGDAPQFIDELRSNNTPFFFLTNDGNNSRQMKCKFLNHCGINAEVEDIISCADVLAGIAKKEGYAGKKFFVLGEISKPAFEASGIIECKNIDEINECCGIINGEGFYDWRPNMEAALGFIMDHPDAPWLVTNPDSYWPNSKTSKYSVGAGGQARFIEGLLRELGYNSSPRYLGKPYTGIYDYTIEKLQKKFPGKTISPDRIYGIGDYLKSDIKGAKSYGMKSVLVLSGVTSQTLLENAEEELRPHLVFDRLA